MSLIDTTYFINEINLPTPYNSDDANLDDFITRFEPDVLDRALGYELSQLVQAYANPGSDQRIIDIVEGKEYTISYNGRDQSVKWKGLVNDDKRSLIAYYVYCYYMRDMITQTTFMGEMQAVGENATAASARGKINQAWQMLRELYGYHGQDQLSASLYVFLTENESDYPEWVFTPIGSMNSFNL